MKRHSDWPYRQLIIVAMLPPLSIIIVALFVLVKASHASTHLQANTTAPLEQSIIVLSSADTYIAEGAPERRRPNLRVMWVGRNESQGSLMQRSLLRFDLTNLPTTAQITSARLDLTLSSTTSGDSPLALSLYQIRGEWAEDINWQEMSSAVANGTLTRENEAATSLIGTTFEQYSWDVLRLVDNWQTSGRDDGSQDDQNSIGFLLQSEAITSERERAFWTRECAESDCGSLPGKRPTLTITYAENSPIPTPAPTSVPLQPEPDITVDIEYLRGSDEPTDRIPTDWQDGEVLDIRLTLTRVNSDQSIAGINLQSKIPAGVEFVSAGQGGALNESSGTIEWRSLAVPGNGSQSVGYRLRKPVPISGPSINIDQTAASTIVIFDAVVEKGSDLSVIWDFGDGSPSVRRPDLFVQTLQIQHNYQEQGEYTVTMHIYNAACRVTVRETFALTAVRNQIANNANAPWIFGASRAFPNTDGTALLPLCPDSITPIEPPTTVQWTENGQTNVRYANSEALYLPMLFSGQ